MSDANTLVPINRFCDAYEAHILRGLLETHGIPSFVFDNLHGQNAWYIQHMLGTRVMVRQCDLAQAMDIVNTTTIEPLELPEGEITPLSMAEHATLPEKIISFLVTIFTGVTFFFPRK